MCPSKSLLIDRQLQSQGIDSLGSAPADKDEFAAWLGAYLQSDPTDEQLQFCLHEVYRANPASEVTLYFANYFSDFAHTADPALFYLLARLGDTADNVSEKAVSKWPPPVATMLQDIKKAFSVTSSKHVTATGAPRVRPREALMPYNYTEEDATWTKYIPQLLWICKHASTSDILLHWSLLVPPVLILLDDQHVANRISGLQSLKHIAARPIGDKLKSSGLGKVFMDASFTSVHYLPPTVPEQDSHQMIRLTVTNMTCIARLIHLPSLPAIAADLNPLLNQGIIRAFVYCSDQEATAICLFECLAQLIAEMEIYAVNYLHNILDVICDTMDSVLNGSKVALLAAAITCLHTTFTYCWPRIPKHHVRILASLAKCWTYTDDADIHASLHTLSLALQSLLDISPDTSYLRQHNPHLQHLL